jgi:hypothetical protein
VYIYTHILLLPECFSLLSIHDYRRQAAEKEMSARMAFVLSNGGIGKNKKIYIFTQREERKEGIFKNEVQ